MSISDFSSRRQQTLAPIGTHSQLMSGMRPRMVGLLPLLPSGPKSHLEKPSSQLPALQQAAAARSARGIDCSPKSFLCGRDTDRDIRFAIISVLEVSREAVKGASEARILTLQIHEALVKPYRHQQ
jgi:hypothetical protein